MAKHSITLVTNPILPPGFAIEHREGENGAEQYLVRMLDKREARIVWTDGTRQYTPAQLSAIMMEEGDHDDPKLKAFLE